MEYELTVFYDGNCILCAHEIAYYKALRNSERIQWIDISSADFSPQDHFLDQNEIQKSLHAKTLSGEVLTGIDSFAAIWETLGIFPFLLKIIRIDSIRPIFQIGYKTFAKIRPWLPKRRRDICNSEACQKTL